MSSPRDFSNPIMGADNEIFSTVLPTALPNPQVPNDELLPAVLPPTLHNAQIPVFNIRPANAQPVAYADVTVGDAGEARPPGRPRGSKNKPRSEKDSIMNSVVLEIPHGADITNWVVNFANKKRASIVVVGGSGAICEVTLSHMGSQNPPVTYTEHLLLISISGSYIYSGSTESSPVFFSVSLAREDGSLVAGTPSRLVARGPVMLTASIYKNPETFHIAMVAEG